MAAEGRRWAPRSHLGFHGAEAAARSRGRMGAVAALPCPWEVEAHEHIERPMSTSKREFVIVGGGIYGVATAWHLAQAGAEVVVLEAHEVGAGASGGLGKRGVRANGRDLRELPLMRIAYDLWPDLSATLATDTGWEPVGHLQLYERFHDVGAAAARARVQESAGVPTRHLDLAGVRDLEPGLSDVILGALHCPRDGVADHTATTVGYARRAREAGVEIREGAEVVRILASGGRARSVELAEGERIEIGRDLLLLANAGVQRLVEETFARRLPVWTIYPQAMRTDPLPEAPFRSLFGHAHRPVALKTLADGAVMLSGGWRGRRDPETGRGETLPDAVQGNWDEAVRLFPRLVGVQPIEAVADRGETSCVDGIPILDRLPEAPNTLVGCGWTGHGWAIAPAVAPLLADFALDGAPPPLLCPFSLARFEAT